MTSTKNHQELKRVYSFSSSSSIPKLCLVSTFRRGKTEKRPTKLTMNKKAIIQEREGFLYSFTFWGSPASVAFATRWLIAKRKVPKPPVHIKTHQPSLERRRHKDCVIEFLSFTAGGDPGGSNDACLDDCILLASERENPRHPQADDDFRPDLDREEPEQPCRDTH